VSNNWNFAIAGYSITAVVLVSYFTWIRQKSRQLRRNLRDETHD
jgi:hypothetical protein